MRSALLFSPEPQRSSIGIDWHHRSLPAPGSSAANPSWSPAARTPTPLTSSPAGATASSKCASATKRVALRTVIGSPSQATACRSDSYSRSTMVCSSSPARRSAASRSPSATRSGTGGSTPWRSRCRWPCEFDSRHPLDIKRPSRRAFFVLQSGALAVAIRLGPLVLEAPRWSTELQLFPLCSGHDVRPLTAVQLILLC